MVAVALEPTARWSYRCGVLIGRAHPGLRGRRRTSVRCLHFLAAFLATLGASVGFLKSSFPSRSQFRATSVVVGLDGTSQSSDDSGSQVRQPRTHKGGLRRAAPTLGPGFPDDDASRELTADDRALRPDRDVLIPRSFVPPPPFHPPRAAWVDPCLCDRRSRKPRVRLPARARNDQRGMLCTRCWTAIATAEAVHTMALLDVRSRAPRQRLGAIPV